MCVCSLWLKCAYSRVLVCHYCLILYYFLIILLSCGRSLGECLLVEIHAEYFLYFKFLMIIITSIGITASAHNICGRYYSFSLFNFVPI